MTRSFMKPTPHQILLVWSNRDGDIAVIRGMYKCIRDLGEET
jgi:hypothetical protein